MSDGSSVPPDPVRAWLEATGGAEARGTGDAEGEPRAASRRLLTLTAAVTAVALALGGVAVNGRTGTVTPAAAAPSIVPAPVSPAPPTPGAGASSLAAGPTEVPADAAAAAVLAVRSSATGDRYVDTAVAMGLDTRGEFAVVTVAAWVLHRDGGAWDGGAPHRYAVAVGDAGSGPIALAPPWLLPAPPTQVAKRSWTPVGDAALAAAAAETLRRTGYRDLRDLTLGTDGQFPHVLGAAVEATGPGDVRSRSHEVWLSADAATVLGDAEPPALPIPGAQP